MQSLIALYIRSSSATILACEFTYNTRALNADNSSIFIDYSSFIGHVGLRIVSIENGHDKSVTILNSIFSDNAHSFSTRGNGAGALSVFTSYLELHNVTFHNNRGVTGGALAVLNTQSIVTISQCKFIGNVASHRGGAIFTSSSITVRQSIFSNNVVPDFEYRYYYPLKGGGAIFVSGSSIYISIHLSRFLNNEVEMGAGGAVYIAGSNNSLRHI